MRRFCGLTLKFLLAFCTTIIVFNIALQLHMTYHLNKSAEKPVPGNKKSDLTETTNKKQRTGASIAHTTAQISSFPNLELKSAELKSMEPKYGPKSVDPNQGPKSADPNHGPKSIDLNHGPKSADPNHAPESIDLNHGPESADPNHVPESADPNHGPKSVDQNHELKSINQSQENKTHGSSCPKMTIHRNDEIKHFSKDRLCRPHMTPEEVCKYTADLFAADPSIATCHDQEDPPYKICSISEERTGTSKFKAKCDLSACDRQRKVQLEIVGPSDGEMRLLDLPPGTSERHLERYVEDAAKRTRENGFNFLFVDCVGRNNGGKISQMLTLTPPEKVFKRQDGDLTDKVNVNVILLDSIARSHFYRSLPKTVEYLREKHHDPNHNAHIFDFELFQSVHGHTHENEHALFSGALYPKDITREEKERAPTNMEVLFGVFKDAGYQTMYQNDICWKSYYGLIDSLKAEDWKSLQTKKKEANIDSTGITDASCKIVGRYGSTTAFHDNDDHQICFNGQHHHKHLFDYLTHYLEVINNTRPQSKPLFSYTETNVAHENIGVRVRTLDQDLVDLIETASNEANTVTIIFADHGNTYTTYQVTMLEGRLEMYHPVLLAVLPKRLGRKLGPGVVTNLKTNQYRLLNLFDIRAGLVELARYDGRSFKPAGIFGKISEQRTCDDLQLSTPNFCICEGWDSPVANSTAQLALAEFAIGQLNNQIQDAQLASRAHDGPSRTHDGPSRAHDKPFRRLSGSCQRLRIQRIGNVRQRHTAEGTLVTTMDATVQSGNIVKQEELIMLQVESNQRQGMTSYEMKLVSFNRISEYGFYKECADPGVNLKLCVCDRPDRRPVRDVVDPASSVTKLGPCLLLMRRKYNENVGQEDHVGVAVFELANICWDRKFNVTFSPVTENLRSSTELPLALRLRARSVYFVTTMMTEVGYYKPKLELHYRIVSGREEEHGGNG